MDIARVGVAQRKRRRLQVTVGVVAVLAAVVTVGLSRLKPAVPSVDRDTIWTGRVERGEMLRQVRGSGTLVPEEIRWIPAATAGRVEQRLLEPGAVVDSDTVILVLSNPEVEQETVEAESQVHIAEAELTNLRAQLENQLISFKVEVARIESEADQARLRAAANDELAKKGLVSSVEVNVVRAQASSLATRAELERQRVEVFARSITAQVAAQEAEVEQRRAMHRLREKLRDSLTVRAGSAGVLQDVTVEVGQQVTPGMNLARVAEPSHLMARVRVPATQARDVTVGLDATVDARSGLIPAKVVRIDPAVREGTVTVDLKLLGELPRGARPDLNVDGTIQLERLEDVVYVGRPAFGQEAATVGLFRIEPDGSHATRVQVTLGRTSVNTVEVVKGLEPGDEVILSDTSRFDDYDRIRLD